MENNAQTRFQIKIEYLWAQAVLAGIFIFVNTHPIRPNDFWFHLAFGRFFSQTGRIPVVDFFSFTMAGASYQSAYNYWLAQWFMYELYELGGAEWTILFFSLIVTIAYGVILIIGLQRTKNLRLAAWGTLFAAMLGFSNWNIRPQLFAYLLAALSILAIEKYKVARRPWFWAAVLILVMAMWANCHATFFIPIVLAGFWLLERAFHAIKHRTPVAIVRPLGLGAIMSAGVLINPRGFKVFDYLVNASTAHSLQGYISEWQPSNFASVDSVVFFILLALTCILWVLGRTRVSLSEGLSFLFFAFLALRYSRAIVWFGLTQAPLFVSILHSLYYRFAKPLHLSERVFPKLNLAFALLLGLWTLLSVPWLREYWPLSSQKKDLYALETPVKAVAYMDENRLPENVFSDIGFSSYIMWAGDSKFKVFADPRFDLYPVEIWSDYIDISTAASGWEVILSSYDVDVLVLSTKMQRDLILAAQLSRTWQQVYEDEIAVIFVRDK